jgi:SAM-dependent methyltransferase
MTLSVEMDRCYRQSTRLQQEMIEARYRSASDFVLRRTPVDHWLDIGPNLGFGLSGLVGIRPSAIIAAEVNYGYARTAKQNHRPVNIVQMDGCRLGLSDTSVTCASCFEVIEHLDEPCQRLLLGDIYRVLRPGSFFFMSTPNKPASGKRKLSPDHLREIDQPQAEQLLLDSGFEIIETRGQMFLQNGKLQDRLFRVLRQNHALAWIYHNVLPLSLMKTIRDANFTAQSATQIRPPHEGETPRCNYFICLKP